MRKPLYILSALVALSAVAQNKTMFIHRGGDIDVMFFSEIDSIRYSDIGLDSTALGEIHIQEIWIADSVYRYDIAEIDSVTFQSPATVAKPGSVDLAGELAAYVLGDDYSDGITLYLSGNTPSGIMPKSGQYLYQLDPSDALPSGFAGHVLSVESSGGKWIVKCESSELDDIFDQLVWVGQNEFSLGDGESDTNPDESAEQSSMYRSVVLPTLASTLSYPDLISGVVSMTEELKDIPAGPEQAEIKAKIALRPTVYCQSGAYILRNSNGETMSMRRMFTMLNVGVSGYANGRYNIGDERTIGQNNNPLKFTLPMGLGQSYTLNYSGTMVLGGKMGLDYSFDSQYRSSMTTSVRYNDNVAEVVMKYTHKAIKSEERELDASFDGSLSLKGSLTFSVTQSGDSLKSISNTYTYGSSLKGNALFLSSQIEEAKTDNTLYQTITSTGVKATSVESVAASVKYSDATYKLIGKITPSSSETYYVVPKFTSVAWSNSAGTMTYTVEGAPMGFSKASLGTAVESASDGTFSHNVSDKVWPRDCRSSFVGETSYDSSTIDMVYPTVTLPTGERILGAPAYPCISNDIYPVISVQEVNGIRVTSGIPIIGSASNGTESLQIGNIFPYK